MKLAKIVFLSVLLTSSSILGLVSSTRAQVEPVLEIAVSVAPLGGIVDEVGQGYVSIHVILPEGVEPHAAQLSQEAIEAALAADLLVLTGHYPWEEMLANQTQTPHITLEDYEAAGAVLSPIPGNPHIGESEGDQHEHGNENLHTYWLLPRNALAIANATLNEFDILSPDYSDFWHASFEQFREDIEAFQDLVLEVDEEYHFSDLSAVVVFPAEAYIAETFGIEVRAVLQAGDNIFISGSELLAVQTALANGSIDVILGSDIARLQAGGEFAEQLAADTGSQVIWWRAIFFSGLSDFVSIMTYNLGVLTASLGDKPPSEVGDTTNYLAIGVAGFLSVVVLVETVLIVQRIRSEE
ncbi:MAG: metal ABC transporter solute-binding protein, Zn/Mn family [Candidatus Thorarchaeota archaeon]